jgi:hypothetical protein
MKSGSLRVEYIKCCTRKGIKHVVSLKAWVSKLRGTKGGANKDNSGIYLHTENFKILLHMFL